MNSFGMKLGDTAIGLVYDGIEENELLYGQMIIDENYGPLLVVSFPDDIFGEKDPHWWKQADVIPEVLCFRSVEGSASFLDCVVIRRKRRFSGVSEITMRPATVIYDLVSKNKEGPLEATQVTSTIEYLGEWLDQGSMTTRLEQDGSGKAVAFEIRVETSPSKNLTLSNMNVELSTPWRGRSNHGQASIETNGQISTNAKRPLPVDDHLNVHKRLRDFLVISTGKPVKISGHKLNFEVESDSLEFTHFSTAREQFAAEHDVPRGVDHLIDFNEVVTSKLEAWLETDSSLAGKTGALIQLLEREHFTSTDRVIYAGMTAESLGKELPPVLGDTFTYSGCPTTNSPGKPTQYTYVLRCIAHSRLNFTNSPLSIYEASKAIAQNYNKTKHYEPAKTPEPSVSIILGRVLAVALRKLMTRAVRAKPPMSYPEPDDREARFAVGALENIGLDEIGWPRYRVVTEDIES